MKLNTEVMKSEARNQNAEAKFDFRLQIEARSTE